jgi:hypothetical protein
MTTEATNQAVGGAWHAQLTFTEGPRRGTGEPVRLTPLPDGVVINADEIRPENAQLPRGIGEWTTEEEPFSYWFNVVANEPSGLRTNRRGARTMLFMCTARGLSRPTGAGVHRQRRRPGLRTRRPGDASCGPARHPRGSV